MKTCCICPGTSPSPCHPPHDSSPVARTSWLFCLPSATHVSSLGLHSIVTSSQNHLQIDKIHLVCWVQNIDIKCAGPPNINFPPFHRFRGWYLTVTLSLKMMTRGRGWEVLLPTLTSWPGQKEGWNKYKINIYITLLLDSLSLTSFWCILRPRLKILDSCKLGILPNPLVAWVAQSGHY